MLLFTPRQWIEDPIPTVFVRDSMSMFFLVGMVIPLIFLLLKLTSFYLLSVELSDRLIGVIWFAWPVVSTQYEIMKEMGLLIDAVNYSAFLSINFLFFILVFILIIIKYIKVRDRMWMPDNRDLAVIGMGVGFYLVTLFDHITTDPHDKLFLSIDKSGTYYFRQYMVISFIAFTTLVMLLSLIKVSDRIKEYIITKTE